MSIREDIIEDIVLKLKNINTIKMGAVTREPQVLSERVL
jgi:hypothetical protein